MTTKYCESCGNQVMPTMRMCPQCGNKTFSQTPVQAKNTSTSTQAQSTSAQFSNNLSPNTLSVTPRPWVRLWARLLDVYIFAIACGLLIELIDPQKLQKINQFALGIILAFAWIFVESLLLSSFGTTFGKSLFKIKITLKNSSVITYSEALSRSMKVWLRGMGAGIPLVSLITHIVAYIRLTDNGTTSWDREGNFTISHEKIGFGRILVAIVLITVFVLLIAIGMAPR